MPLITHHTRRVRQALSRPARLGVELFVLLLVASVLAVLVVIGRQVRAPLHQTVAIDLRFRALPGYTMLSLGRGFLAYLLSLAFTLVYGTVAAHNRRAEKLMLPALDVLQAIPVLGFLPGLVLAMIALFPTREIGLELACVVMIFTAQAWNMTFSFHGSLRGIPTSAREVAAVNRLGAWQTFRLLEVPAAMIGLVWNSMMSMAGGWFFLTVNEAFTLGNRDYRLPGIGSYMNEAINRGDVPAMVAAVVAMVVMIVTVDRLLWRPIVVWSQKYKIEDTPEADPPRSLVLEILRRSRLHRWLLRLLRRRESGVARRVVAAARAVDPAAAAGGRAIAVAGRLLRWLVVAALAAGAVAGTLTLVRLLSALPLAHGRNGHDWAHVALALLASFARTTAAVAIAAAWALPAGIWIGRSPKWSRRLQPLVQVTASFPAPMLFPLVTLLLLAMHVPFTIGCVALMLMGAQWYVLFNVIAGAVAIPADLKEVAAANDMPRRTRWSRLYVPCVFPYLVTGLVTAAGGAWNATIVSEYVNFKDRTFSAFGLGSTISHATAEGDFPLLCAAIVTMAVFVVLVNRVFWKRMYRLAEERYSLNV